MTERKKLIWKYRYACKILLIQKMTQDCLTKIIIFRLRQITWKLVNLSFWILSYRHDLAELLLKLRQYDKAEKVLKQSLEAESGVCL